MRARLARNWMQLGHIARDYIRMVEESQNSSTANPKSEGRAAHTILESLEDQDRSLPVDPVVPIKSLVTVLTESLQGMPVADTDGGISGARLYRGCPVRLRGLPERRFIIRDIYWDCEEVRVLELGTEVYYLVPWDCLQFDEEQER
jgi:hypothetical protein